MKSVIRPFALAAIVVSASFASAQGPIERVRESESEVRSMPIEQRPNRLGHFYGNNVRRLHHRTLFVNAKHADRPFARYLYVSR